MTAETIDHNTLLHLVEAGTVHGAHVFAQAGGWGILIKYGMLERPLAATRSKKIRTFRRLETLVAYLKEIGIGQFDVDATQYNPATIQTRKRPDRAEAMRNTHEAAEHDRWFKKQVEQALQEADDPNTLWIPHEVVRADMQRQREALLMRTKQAK